MHLFGGQEIDVEAEKYIAIIKEVERLLEVG